MNLTNALKKMIDDCRTSYGRLAERMGYKKASSIGDIVARCDTKVSILMRICDELDYDIVLKPRGGSEVANRTIVLNELPDRVDNRGSYDRG
jgi:hypothetical protein